MGEDTKFGGGKRNAHKLLFRKPKGKRPLSRTGCRWENDTKINLKGMGCGLGSSSVDRD
jgi:hypothetical protein